MASIARSSPWAPLGRQVLASLKPEVACGAYARYHFVSSNPHENLLVKRAVPTLASAKFLSSLCFRGAPERQLHRGVGLLTCLLVVVAGSPPARGQDLAPVAEPARPDVTTAPLTSEEVEWLELDQGWPAGSVQQQLDRDTTLIPYGKGALFVPAMTNGLDEPPVIVSQDGKEVVDSTAGVRIVLPAGKYTVELGSGSVLQRFSREINVVELKTTVVPVAWAGITVHVVDPQLNSLRNGYEMIRMSDRAYVGVGFGSDEQNAEPETTWVLHPGLYKIVRVGGTYRDRQDFVTVRLEGGRHVHFLLVQDPTDGSLQGAGEARPEELFKTEKGLWGSFILGGDISLTKRQSVVGKQDGDTWNLQGFVDTKINGELFGNPLLLRLQVAESQSKLPAGAWQVQQDLLQLDLLYIYKMRPWLGPYVRGQGVTNLFPSSATFAPPQTVTVRDPVTGSTEVRTNVTSLALTPPFGTLSFRESAGMNVRVFKNIFAETTLRSGFGLRQMRNTDVLQNTGTNELGAEYSRLTSANIYGLELTLIAIGRITRYIVVNLVADALVPFDRHQRVDLDLQGTVALKLTSYASLNFILNYIRTPTAQNATFQYDLLLRFSLEFL